ncbi:hypothetical protein BURPS305_1696 [Burkholderia pseudomallei 305]|uniref:Uncharacterized protein n=1 Tax=Burkholderia pseudomallei 1710a TaxID=320371 RepID=A0A0E1W269_BURPE|nr:hypothetical protein BURPS668_A1979 [Burkholderia pseudomallei 668]EBA46128.1 hypothetical protein BURPS305_1696 [Burkholderia pseudomallei 305]EDO90053.1 hypothetical protein BURPSPAST_T0269 [Burkholderia pseudomallei Pasteur 52237]EDU11360.1 hypothetical protein BURPS1655_I1017 [Burkholderia pseudomallei 1655]EEC31678.1 conserved hypothetical protein [Burkholderia pseudomallei 576]EEH24948.1 conserved hypothetical protein [Burkholderia pseudomallei Pakistan 9]EEP49300.1 conserved hypothe
MKVSTQADRREGVELMLMRIFIYDVDALFKRDHACDYSIKRCIHSSK